MAETLKALSALLNYPSPDLQAAVRELRAIFGADRSISVAAAGALDSLIDDIADADIYDLQERYVLLFDRTRSLSLHLFEHVHGESRDRGQAMIDLQALYEKSGLAISASELPDFLPLFIEFLSTRPITEARDLLGQTAHILETLCERLEKRGSPYAAVFAALLDLAAARGKGDGAAVAAEEDVDPMDLEALDADWEDEPVTFGPEALPGCRDGLVARLRAAKRPPPAAQPD
jgi:nitrate reductase delta subunit